MISWLHRMNCVNRSRTLCHLDWNFNSAFDGLVLLFLVKRIFSFNTVIIYYAWWWNWLQISSISTVKDRKMHSQYVYKSYYSTSYPSLGSTVKVKHGLKYGLQHSLMQFVCNDDIYWRMTNILKVWIPYSNSP